MKKTVFLLFCIFVLVSCTVTQNLSFDSEKSFSGSSFTLFRTDDFFVNVAEDLSSWQENGNDTPVIDAAVSEFEKNLGYTDSASNILFGKVAENIYAGTFDFTDFNELVSELTEDYPNQKLLQISTLENGKNRFELNLNLETYEVLSGVVPILNDENFKVWGPVYNNPPYDTISEEDYKDMVSWILGEDGPQSIDSSSVLIRINLPTEVVRTNGSIVDDCTVEFSFPLIDFLLLHNPIVFWCEY